MRAAVRIVAFLFVAIVMASRLRAQSIPPNPLYLTLTGVDSEPEIFHDVSLSSYQLLSGSIQFRKDNDRQKVTFAPFKLSETYRPILTETLLNFSQEGGVSTFGIGSGWTNAAPAGKKASAFLKRQFPPPPLAMTPQEPDESDKAFERRSKEYLKEEMHPYYNKFYRELAKNAVRVVAGFNIQTFSILAGDEVDADEDGKVDNRYTMKGYDVSAGVVYTASQTFGMTGTLHFSWKRASSAEDQPLVSYNGFSVSTAGRIALLDKDYLDSPNYLKYLFVPSIVVGAVVEFQDCKADSMACDKLISQQLAATPFVDFKIAPEAQFRIAFPIRDLSLVGKTSGTQLEPIVQLSVQLSGLN